MRAYKPTSIYAVTPFSNVIHVTMRNKKKQKKSEQMNKKNKWNEGFLACVECISFVDLIKGCFFYYLGNEGGF